MSAESDFEILSMIADTTWDVIDSLNQVQVFGFGLFSWMIFFFVAQIVVELIRFLVWGRGGETEK